MLLALKKLNIKTKINFLFLGSGLLLMILSVFMTGYFSQQKLDHFSQLKMQISDLDFKLNIISRYKSGDARKLTMHQINKDAILKELKENAMGLKLNFISYEFNPIRKVNINYGNKKLCSQPVILKVRAISDAQIYDLADKIKNSKLGLIRPINLKIAKIRDVDSSIIIQDLKDKKIDVFKAVFEFEVIGYV